MKPVELRVGLKSFPIKLNASGNLQSKDNRTHPSCYSVIDQNNQSCTENHNGAWDYLHTLKAHNSRVQYLKVNNSAGHVLTVIGKGEGMLVRQPLLLETVEYTAFP